MVHNPLALALQAKAAPYFSKTRNRLSRTGPSILRRRLQSDDRDQLTGAGDYQLIRVMAPPRHGRLPDASGYAESRRAGQCGNGPARWKGAGRKDKRE